MDVTFWRFVVQMSGQVYHPHKKQTERCDEFAWSKAQHLHRNHGWVLVILKSGTHGLCIKLWDYRTNAWQIFPARCLCHVLVCLLSVLWNQRAGRFTLLNSSVFLSSVYPPKHYIMLPGVNLSALAWSHLCWSFRKGVFFSKRAFVCALSPPHFNNCHFLSALPHVLAAAQMNLERRKTCFQTNSSIFYFTFH